MERFLIALIASMVMLFLAAAILMVTDTRILMHAHTAGMLEDREEY